MSDEAQVPDVLDQQDEAQAAPDELEAAVRAAQLSVCTEVVPEAIQLRLEAARAMPEGSWRRTAGAHDPRVIELEEPYRRRDRQLVAEESETSAPKRAAKKTSGSRRRRSTKKEN